MKQHFINGFSVYRSVGVVPISHTFGFFPWLLNVGKLLLGSNLVFVPIVVAIGLGLHPITPAIPRLRTFSLHQDVHCLLFYEATLLLLSFLLRMSWISLDYEQP